MQNVIETAENWAKEMPKDRTVVLLISDGSRQTTYLHGSEINLKAIIAAALIESPELSPLVKEAIKAAVIYKACNGDPTQLFDLDDIENLPEEFKSTKH